MGKRRNQGPCVENATVNELKMKYGKKNMSHFLCIESFLGEFL
jgi:hypothetical protein